MNPDPSSPSFSAARLAAARADTPPVRDLGPLLHAARLAHAAELANASAASPRWTDEFAALFGNTRSLAACAAFSVLLGLGAAVHAGGELAELAALIDLTGPLWEVAS